MAFDSDAARRTRRVAVTMVVLTGAVATALAYYGTRERSPAAPSDKDTPAAFPLTVSIVLPHDEPELPPGANKDRARASCTLCHSPRLLLTQPPLSRDQWTAVVRKMATVYGAPIRPEDETPIVDYLTEVHGP